MAGKKASKIFDPLSGDLSQQARELHKKAFPGSYETETPAPGAEETPAPVSTETPASPVTETPAAAPVETPAVETPTPAREETVEYWRNRFSVLQHKYNSEVPQLHAQLRQLSGNVTELQRQIAELKAAPKTPTTPVEIPSGDDEKAVYRSPYVTDDMRNQPAYKWMLNQYGQTHAEVQTENALLAAQSQLKPVEDRIQDVAGTVESVSAQTAEERFNSHITSRCPSWRGLEAGINKDPAFIEWTFTPEPFLGRTYNELLNEAWQTANAETICKVIEAFEAQTKKPEPPKPSIPETLVVPNKTGGGAKPPLQSQEKILTVAGLQKLYDDNRNGLYRGREGEFEKLRKEYFDAQREGRLRP